MRTFLLLAILLFTTSVKAQSNQSDFRSMSLEELTKVKIFFASNVISELKKQPVSVTTITKDTIRLSGARTLSELLTLYVPGYFTVEDQDDTIAGFRGLVPDNNSKTMLLLNGVSLNTEWFWGPPDAILNGLDLEFIERVEVIRGPGSVTLGQGALLGVINIVTKKSDGVFANVLLNHGKDGLERYTMDVSYQSENLKAYAYIADGRYDGQRLRNQGWASALSNLGLTSYERNHRLKRSDYTNFFSNIRYYDIELDFYHFEQNRDIYSINFDREVVSQTIDGMTGNYHYAINRDIKLKLSAHYTRDDYGLSSHGGNIQTNNRFTHESSGSVFSSIINKVPGRANKSVEPGLTMGGTREERRGGKLLVNWDNLWEGNKLAFGFEYVDFKYGLNDSHGNNFIINEEIQVLGLASDGAGGILETGSVNDNNAWVKPGSVHIRSFFIEDFYSVNDNIDLFAAFRFDEHPNWGSEVSPRIGGFYQIDDNHLFRITWQTGFRGAVGVQFTGGFVQDGFLSQENFSILNELSTSHADFNFDGIAENDSRTILPVQPETLESWELAYTFTKQNLRINGVLFFSTVEDILTAQANGYEGLGFGDNIGTDAIGTWNGNWYYQNQVGQLKQWGYELEIDYEMDKFVFSASQAHVAISSADPGTIGFYVLEGDKTAAYPEDISRFHTRYRNENSYGKWSAQYNHLYYWGYDAPNGISVNGNNISSIGFSWSPVGELNGLQVDLTIKNVWGETGLYPINSTAGIEGTQGSSAVEKTTWWTGVSYKF